MIGSENIYKGGGDYVLMRDLLANIINEIPVVARQAYEHELKELQEPLDRDEHSLIVIQDSIDEVKPVLDRVQGDEEYIDISAHEFQIRTFVPQELLASGANRPVYHEENMVLNFMTSYTRYPISLLLQHLKPAIERREARVTELTQSVEEARELVALQKAERPDFDAMETTYNRWMADFNTEYEGIAAVFVPENRPFLVLTYGGADLTPAQACDEMFSFLEARIDMFDLGKIKRFELGPKKAPAISTTLQVTNPYFEFYSRSQLPLTDLEGVLVPGYGIPSPVAMDAFLTHKKQALLRD